MKARPSMICAIHKKIFIRTSFQTVVDKTTFVVYNANDNYFGILRQPTVARLCCLDDKEAEMLENVREAPKLDPRVRRTRQWLQEALINLMAEKSFEAITVQDIAERAGVN